MKKESIRFSDLSKKELEFLKELYIQKKVDDMNFKELKDFVFDIIGHQIKNTIGKEEEIEAWTEMSIFFGDQFEIIIREIQNKFEFSKNIETMNQDDQKKRLELLEKNNIESKKEDMWGD